MVVDSRTVSIGCRYVELVISRHPRAKNIKIRCDSSGLRVMLTLPKLASVKTGLSFFEKSKKWIEAHLPDVASAHEFKDGSSFPYLGQLYLVQQNKSKTFLAKSAFMHNILHVRGADIHHQTVEWLQQQAALLLHEISHEMAAKLGVKINRIAIKEIKSRWGSCSSMQNLNYSWRIIMAPRSIVEYLCAHEVSHLLEMNHSEKFWAKVETLHPDHKSARKWLRTEGKELFKYSGI